MSDECHPYKTPPFLSLTATVTFFDGADYVTLYALDAFGNVWRLVNHPTADSKVWTSLTAEREKRATYPVST